MISNSLLFLVGASGFIGGDIFRSSREYFVETLGTYRSNQENVALVQFDLSESEPERLKFLRERSEPNRHAIVCSSISQIDLCVKDIQQSTLVNVENTIHLLDYLRAQGFHIGFLSTDQVFSDRADPYTESDIPSPINLYGMQKDLVEKYIIENYDQYLIFRLSKIVAPYRHKNNLFTQWEELIHSDSDILTINKQILCPTSVIDVSRAVLESLYRNLHGIVHIGADPISRTRLAEKFVKHFPKYSGRVRQIEMEEFEFLDTRSTQIVLDSSRIRSELDISLLDSDRIIDQYLNTVSDTR